MYTNRFYRLFELYHNIANAISVSGIHFKRKTNTLWVSRNPKDVRKLKLTVFLSFCWLIEFLMCIYLGRKQNDISGINMSIPFFFITLSATLALCIQVFRPSEICQIASGAFGLMEHVHGKFQTQFRIL